MLKFILVKGQILNWLCAKYCRNTKKGKSIFRCFEIRQVLPILRRQFKFLPVCRPVIHLYFLIS